MKQKWADLFHSDFEVLLYDLTSTYFEGEMQQNPKAKRGYSRDKRPDCLQLVIALVVTTDGLPMAYEVMEVMKGNTSDRTTLPGFLKKIEDTYGKARRVWVMDRGVPSEAILKDMRDPERQTFYLVGTPKSRINQHEKKWLDLPWQKVRDSVEVKLYEHEGELYVLAKSGGRQAKENAMRRKRLARLLRKLRVMRKSRPKRDQLLLRIGAVKKEAGRAFGFVKIQMPPAGQAVTRETFSFQVEKAKLKAAERRDGHYLLRSNLTGEDPAVLWTRLRATDANRECVPLAEKRIEHPAHPSSTGTSGRRTRSDCVPGLLSASHLEEPPDAARAGIEAGRGVRKTGDDPDGRGLDSHDGWPLAGAAAPHTAGKRCPGVIESDPYHTSLPTPTAHQSLPDHARIGRRSAFSVVKTFG